MGYDRDDGRSADRNRFGRDDHEHSRGRNDDDRGFFDRAGDELRSWFGDEEAERRRRYDEANDPRSGGYDRPRGYAYGSGNRSFGQRDSGYGGSSQSYSGASSQSYNSQQGGSEYDRWRQQQIDALDRDYADYRHENQSKFESEFGSWRHQRQTQRTHLQRAEEHMEVVGSDGQHVGTVDTVRGDRIYLTKSDVDAGGHHHSIPSNWIDKVDEKVTITKSAEDAKKAWRDEEKRQALFNADNQRGRDQQSDGPHVLNRSFSGTYER